MATLLEASITGEMAFNEAVRRAEQRSYHSTSTRTSSKKETGPTQPSTRVITGRFRCRSSTASTTPLRDALRMNTDT